MCNMTTKVVCSLFTSQSPHPPLKKIVTGLILEKQKHNSNQQKIDHRLQGQPWWPIWCVSGHGTFVNTLFKNKWSAHSMQPMKMCSSLSYLQWR